MRCVGLTYHDVVAAANRSSSGFTGPGPDRYKIEPRVLEAHLEAFADRGWLPTRVTEPVGAEPRLFLTFDDGGASAESAVAPALDARGWPGHFFLVTARLGDPGFIGAAAARALADAGHVVGSHTHSHAIMTRLTPDAVRAEWRTSKALLEDVLQREVDTASVPRGYVTRAILEAAAEEGYRHVFTSEPWLAPRAVRAARVYGRFPVTDVTSVALVTSFAGAERTAVWRHAAGWYARKAAKRAAGRNYDRVRTKLLSRAARGARERG